MFHSYSNRSLCSGNSTPKASPEVGSSVNRVGNSNNSIIVSGHSSGNSTPTASPEERSSVNRVGNSNNSIVVSENKGDGESVFDSNSQNHCHGRNTFLSDACHETVASNNQHGNASDTSMLNDPTLTVITDFHRPNLTPTSSESTEEIEITFSNPDLCNFSDMLNHNLTEKSIENIPMSDIEGSVDESQDKVFLSKIDQNSNLNRDGLVVENFLTTSEWEWMEPEIFENKRGTFKARGYGDKLSLKLTEVTGYSIKFKRQTTIKASKNFGKREIAIVNVSANCINESPKLGNCPVKYSVNIYNKNPDGRFPITFKQKGVHDHSKQTYAPSRHLAGKTREEAGEEMLKFPTCGAYAEHLADKYFLFKEHTGNATFCKNRQIFKKISMEQRKLEKYDSDPVHGVLKLQAEEESLDKFSSVLKGWVRQFKSLPHILVGIYSELQLRSIPQNPIFQLDCTGGVCTKIAGHDKEPFYYAVTGSPSTKNDPIPVYGNFISTANDAKAICGFLKDWMGDFAVVTGQNLWPSCATCDYSWAFIHGIINAFNDMKLGEYLGFCYDLAIGSPSVLVPQLQEFLKKRFCNVHLCYSHIKKSVSDKIASYGLIKPASLFYKSAFYLMQNSTDIKDFDNIFTKMVYIALSKKFTEKVKIEVDSIIKIYSNVNSNDILEEVSHANKLFDDFDEKTAQVKASSLFHKHYEDMISSIKAEVESEDTKANIDIRRNPFHCPFLITYLLKYFLWCVPMWTGIMFRYERNKTQNLHTRAGNENVESLFSSFKRFHVPNRTPSLDVLIQKIIKSTGGRMAVFNSAGPLRPVKPILGKNKTARKNVLPSIAAPPKPKCFHPETFSDAIDAISKWSKGKKNQTSTPKFNYIAEKPQTSLSSICQITSDSPAVGKNLNCKKDSGEKYPLLSAARNLITPIPPQTQVNTPTEKSNWKIGPFNLDSEDISSLEIDITCQIVDSFLWKMCYDHRNIVHMPSEFSKHLFEALSCPVILNDPYISEGSIEQKCPASLFKWVYDNNLFEKKLWLMPYVIGSNHWILFVVNLEKKEILILNSFGNNRPNEILYPYVNKVSVLIHHCHFMKYKTDLWKPDIFKVYRPCNNRVQTDGISCGLFVCLYAFNICERKMEISQQSVNNFFRNYVRTEILNCNMTDDSTYNEEYVNYVFNAGTHSDFDMIPDSPWSRKYAPGAKFFPNNSEMIDLPTYLSSLRVDK